MGWRTWESLTAAFRQPPGRTSIELTSTPELSGPTAEVVCDLEEALAIAAGAPGAGHMWIIDGGQVHAAAIADPRLTERHVTTVDVCVDGDAIAPAMDDSWTVEEVVALTISSSGVSYRIDQHTAQLRRACPLCAKELVEVVTVGA
jgi:dihydrofolate reductase